MVTVRDLQLPDGRTLRVHDGGEGGADATGASGSSALTVLWHHGSPQTGAPLEPLLTAAAARGIRLLSYGRPSYGGSSPLPGRTVGSAADDVRHIAEAFGIESMAMLGASGGGPHALAAAAALPDIVVATATLASLAPYESAAIGSAAAPDRPGVIRPSPEPDWFAGMATDGASLRAAVEGRVTKERYEESADFDPSSFIARDYAVLGSSWASLGEDVNVASTAGNEGLIDDDLAFVAPWGVDLGSIVTPVLLVQGGLDRVVPASHADRLLRRIPMAELWLRPDDGHLSVLEAVPVAMDWLLAASASRP
ncbi:alpha/beta fold hydrolase [Plantibacter sp. Mn2098]|uniref:alpha/beta fold hydrolase n=1 Tax=Plantibacter sp. Mn2098 TaxID=3395266 RepID=UPI003BBA85F4